MSTDLATRDVVTIRNNVLLSGVVGALGLLLGLALLLRGSVLDALLGLVVLGVAALCVPALIAPSAPVLVVDPQGIRFRLGTTWRGLPWEEVRQVVVEEGISLLRDGRLVVVPVDPGAALAHLGAFARWHVRWNERWFGAAIGLPLGRTTVVDVEDLAGALRALADGRTEVVAMDLPASADAEAEQPPPATVMPARDLQAPARFEVRLEQPVVPHQREAEELAEPLVLAPWDHEAPIEIVLEDDVEDDVEHDGAQPEEARREPLIGAKIVHAREMLDMSIEELSQRTRIRPHVLEAIEQDDFGPCGGDFYARGHLTAIARVLGLTLDPLLKTYDEQYAQAPINARRVFEAELSTGLSSGMRATLGGPRWSLVVGAVLSLTMIWAVARMFAGSPADVTLAPDPGSQTAGLSANRTPITSPQMKPTSITLTAAHASTHVVVRDRTRKVLWSGDLALGHHRRIVGVAPFRVSADNAGAIEVSLHGQQRGPVGTAGEAGSATFR